MKPMLLKKLDAALGWPVAISASLLGILNFRRGRRDRPLIVRPGGMGDLILLCAALEELELNPQRFDWLIETRSRAWADKLALNYVCYDEALLSSLWKLAGRYPTVINTEQRYGLAGAASRLAAGRSGKVVAFETNRASRFADALAPYDPFSTHETETFKAILRCALGLCPLPARPSTRQRRARASSPPLVGLGGLHAPSRALSEERWHEMIHAWSRGRAFLLTSAPEDAEFARRLGGRFKGQAEVLFRPFDELCELIESSEEILTIDSGFLHLASYYGVPTTAIFTSSREKKWRPIAAGSSVVKRSDLACQPCALFSQVPRCHYHYACKDLNFNVHRLRTERDTI